MLAPFHHGPGDCAARKRARIGVMSTPACPMRGLGRISSRRPAGQAMDGQALIWMGYELAHPAALPVDPPIPIARLSKESCLLSDAITFVRDSAFVCAVASSCTRWPVVCRHLLIVSEFALSACLAIVHDNRSWIVRPSISSSSVSGGSGAGRLRDMRGRKRPSRRR